MAKKRKAGGKRVAVAASSACHGQEGGKAAAIVGSRVKEGAFCMKSSRGVPFLVVSDRDLVAGLPRPSEEEFQELLALCSGVAKQWEARGAVVLSDFEGELMGIEGELVSAAFQRSLVLDAKGLNPLPGGGASRDTGLLLDLRCAPCVALTKRIMESDAVCKAIWGADGDVASLRYTPVSKPLGIASANVLDVQLAYSETGRRLSMANMLKRLPPSSIAGLPDKAEAGGLDFAAAHGRNRRALLLPLPRPAAAYAVDDLHRVEAVLQAGKPSGGSYLQARSRSSAVVSGILRSPASLTNEKMRIFGNQLRKGEEKQRLSVAVRIKRHLQALRRINFGDAATDAALGNYAALEADADQALMRAEVVIPEDLSLFSPQTEVRDKEQARDGPALPREEEQAGQTASGATRGKKKRKAAMKTASVEAAGAAAAEATAAEVAAAAAAKAAAEAAGAAAREAVGKTVAEAAAAAAAPQEAQVAGRSDTGAPATRRAKRRRGAQAEDSPAEPKKIKRRKKAAQQA